jgi:hypothetical protein
MAAGSEKPLPLPARPLFRPQARQVHTLPPLDAVRSMVAEATKAPAGPKLGVMAEIAAKDAAQKEADAAAASERVATAIAEKLAPVVEQAFAKLTDDLYNAAVIQNPAAVATTQGRVTNFSVTSTTPRLAYKNDDLGPVMVVVRADGDVSEILGSSSEFGETQAQMRGQNQIGVVLQPRQPLFVIVRSANYGAGLNVVVTIIPLRGKATVFGG